MSDVTARTGEYKLEIRTPDGRLNIDKLAVGLNFIFNEVREGKTVSTELVLELLQFHRESLKDSNDPLCILQAFRLCGILGVPPPYWLCFEIDGLILDAIPDRKWQQAASFHDDGFLALGVLHERADPRENLPGDVYERTEVILREVGIEKDAETIRKARQRYDKRRKEEPHREVPQLTYMFIDLLNRLREGKEVPTDDEALEWLGLDGGGNKL